ncbi:MAG: hypothetical protein JWN52_922 [Actinomycetia bacterium]|nr:hypothetical protein [Actinomycetes bacterium]
MSNDPNGPPVPPYGKGDDPSVQENPISRSSGTSGGQTDPEPTEQEVGIPDSPHGMGESMTRRAEEIADTEFEGTGPSGRPYGKAEDNPMHAD